MKKPIRCVPILVVGALLAPCAHLAAQIPGPEDTVVLEVSGMWDEGCEEYVTETLLGELEGVWEANADAKAGRVTVTFDPALTSPDALAEAIEQCSNLEVEGSTTHALRERARRDGSCCGGISCKIGDRSVV